MWRPGFEALSCSASGWPIGDLPLPGRSSRSLRVRGEPHALTRIWPERWQLGSAAITRRSRFAGSPRSWDLQGPPGKCLRYRRNRINPLIDLGHRQRWQTAHHPVDLRQRVIPARQREPSECRTDTSSSVRSGRECQPDPGAKALLAVPTQVAGGQASVALSVARSRRVCTL